MVRWEDGGATCNGLRTAKRGRRHAEVRDAIELSLPNSAKVARANWEAREGEIEIGDGKEGLCMMW